VRKLHKVTAKIKTATAMQTELTFLVDWERDKRREEGVEERRLSGCRMGADAAKLACGIGAKRYVPFTRNGGGWGYGMKGERQ
jgi:hypothetical protein